MSGQWRLGDSVLRRWVDIGSSAFLCGSDIGSLVLQFFGAGLLLGIWLFDAGLLLCLLFLGTGLLFCLLFFGAGLLLDIWLFGARMMPGFGSPVRGCCSAFGSSARA